MLLQSWLSSLNSSRPRRAGKAVRRRRRAPVNCGIAAEYLEDRTLLAAVELISVADPSIPPSDSANGHSQTQRVSNDGRFVVFGSSAVNLDHGDNTFRQDIYLRDRLLGTTTLVSMNASGTGNGNGHSFDPVISADGSKVAFRSQASDLVSNDTNGTNYDVFLYDVATATNTLVSVNSSGTGSGNSSSYEPVISADGSKVAFRSNASNLVSNDTNGTTLDVFLYDVATATNTLVSVNSTGTGSGNNHSLDPVISADGSKVAFRSNASNLVNNDTNGATLDVFLYDVATATNTLVSVNRFGTGSGSSSSYEPVISADGSKVAFQSNASNLVSNDTNGALADVFLYDVATATNTLVSVNSTGTGSGNNPSYDPVISADGSKVAFRSQASNLVGNDTNGTTQDVFLYDVATVTNTLVSVNSTGTGSGDRHSYEPVISADGSKVAFRSLASDLVGIDKNGTHTDVFLYDVASATNTLMSVNSTGTGSGNNQSYGPEISADGSTVTFVSHANDLISDDDNSNQDVFAWENGTTELISVANPNLDSVTPDLWSYAYQRHSTSDDGRYVVFESGASNLVPGDDNGQSDIFLRDRLLGMTTLVSHHSSGTGTANGPSWNPEISDDGSKIVFRSRASDLSTNDTNNLDDIFLYDVATATNTLVSVNSSGTGSGNSYSFEPVISADASKVAFRSQASDLVGNDTDNSADIFLYDVTTATNTLVSVNSSGTGSGNNDSYTPVISADGSKVAFRSHAYNLVGNDTNWSQADVFLYDVTTATNTLVSVNSSGTGSGNSNSYEPVISADGSTVVFRSCATDLSSLDTDSHDDIFLYDVASGTNTLVSVDSTGTGSGNNHSFTSSRLPLISADGSRVVFQSGASNLTSNDTDSLYDIFLFDVATGTNTLVSGDSTGTTSGNGHSYSPVISPDGSMVAFSSQGTNITADDTDTYDDVFLFDVATGVNTLISLNLTETASGNLWSYDPSFSGDGTTIVFSSTASDLILDDYNNTDDVFAYDLNAPPTAVAGGPYSVAEGSDLTLDASDSSDPNEANSSLTFEWDLDGDGVFGETGAAASFGDETGAFPEFSSLGVSGGSILSLSLRVTDSQGATDTATTTITVRPTTLRWQGDIDQNWSTPGNWLEGFSPIDGDLLVFDTTTVGFASGFTSLNDIIDLHLASIEIHDDSSAGDFLLSGNEVSLTDGLVTSGSEGVATISLNAIALDASQVFDLSLDTTITSEINASSANASYDLTVVADAGTVQFNGLGSQLDHEPGSLSITSTGTLTLEGPVSTSGGNIDLSASVIELGDAVTVFDGDVSVVADEFQIGPLATINAGAGEVAITNKSNDRQIDLGTKTAGRLGLTDAELDRITADVLRIGSTATGAVNFTALGVGPDNVTTALSLISDWGIYNGGGAGTVTFDGGLRLEARANVSLTGANDIDTLAVDNNRGNVQFVDADGFIVGTVDGDAGISSQDAGWVVLTASSGDVTIQDTAAANDIETLGGIQVTLNGADAQLILAAGANIESTSQPHTYTADRIDLQGTITAGGQTVTLANRSSNRQIELGSETAGKLSLTDAELDRITADVLRVGSTTAGAITISALGVGPDNVATALSLLSNSAIFNGGGAGTLTFAGGLRVDVHSGLNMTGNNDVDTLAVDTNTGNVQFTDIDGFVVGTVDGVAGIDDDAAGTVWLVAKSGDVTISDTSAANDIETLGSVRITLEGTDAQLTLAAGADIESTGLPHTYTADRIDLQGTITAGGQTVTLANRSSNRQIDLGSETAGKLSLTDAELDRITADVLRVGSTSAGAITISALGVGPDNVATALSLLSNSAIFNGSGAGTLTFAGGLRVDVHSGLNLTGNNDIDTLAVDTNTGNVQFTDIDGFVVGTVDGEAGIDDDAAGTVWLVARSGDVTISDTSAANDIETLGSVQITLEGADAQLTLAAGADIESTGLLHTYTADRMDLQGTISAGGQTVTLANRSSNRQIELGSETAGKLSLTDAELDRITADVLRVGSTTAGAITISALGVGPDNVATALSLLSNSAIFNGGGAGTLTFAGGLRVDVHSGLNMTGNNDVDTLAVDTNTGNVQFTDIDGFVVGTVDGEAGIDDDAAGTVWLVAKSGDVTISDTSAANDIETLGSVLITLEGADAQLTLAAGADIESTGQPHTYTADRMDLQGTISAGGQTVTLANRSSNRQIELGSETAGKLSLTDAELDRITADVLRVGSTSAGAITISALGVGPDNVATALSLLSNSAIFNGGGAGTLTFAGGLRVDVHSGLNMTGNNDIDTLAVDTNTGNVQFTDIDGFVVGTVDGEAGIDDDAAGTVWLVARSGDVTISDTSAANDIETLGSVLITLEGADAQLTLAAGADIESTGLPHTYTADRMDLQGTITAGGQTVTLKPFSTLQAINLGSATDAATDTLELSAVELDGIAADVLRVGSTTVGNITITDAVGLASVETLHLHSAGIIDDGVSGTIVVNNLAIESAGSVVLDNWELGNSASVLAVSVTDVGAGIHFENNGGLVIGSVDGVVGTTSNGGGITIVTHSPLTISAPVQEVGGGNIQLIASDSTGDDDNLVIQSSITATGGDGSIELIAGDDLTIGDQTAEEIAVSGTGNISITAEGDIQFADGVTLVTEQGELQVAASSTSLSGTEDDDHVEVIPTPDPAQLQVLRDGIIVGTFTVNEKLIVRGLGGDDTIEVVGYTEIDVWFFGDAGHDRLKGGNGDDVLLGGSGDDLLVGHQGRDFLAGGSGADRIVGNADDDIIIADELIWESEAFSLLNSALTAITAEWTRQDRTYEERIENLDGDENFVGDRFNGDYALKLDATVLSDTSSDKLTGSSGSDWFWFDQELDRATDLKDEVFAEELEWILL